MADLREKRVLQAAEFRTDRRLGQQFLKQMFDPAPGANHLTRLAGGVTDALVDLEDQAIEYGQ